MDVVRFPCSHCQKLMGVGPELAGQRVRCPHCQRVLVAPAADVVPSESENLFQFGEAPVSAEPSAVLSSAVEETALAFDAREEQREDAIAESRTPIGPKPASGGALNWCSGSSRHTRSS